MIARGFKPVAWVAAVGGAALSCYMVSLNVATERAELEKIERQILIAKRDIRSLQTELGTRGRLQQLEHWNAEVLALSAPANQQFLDGGFQLARLNRPEPGIGDARVQLASADAVAQPAIKPAVARAFEEPKPAETLVRKASLVVADKSVAEAPVQKLAQAAPPKVAPVKVAPRVAPAPVKKSGLLDDALVREIGEAARAETSGNAKAR